MIERLRQLRGFEVVEVGNPNGFVRCEDLEAVYPLPQLVLVDWVNYASGVRNDISLLATWCRERGVLLVIDGVQGIGAARLDFDLREIAGLACGGHKWLHGPEGTGFVYVAPWFAAGLIPRFAGWRSLKNPDDLDPIGLVFTREARVFEVSTVNHIGFAGLAAAIRAMCNRGLSNRIERLQRVRQRICQCLASQPDIESTPPLQNNRAAGIVSFRHSRFSNAEILQGLSANGIVAVERAGFIRLSPSADVCGDELINRLNMSLGIQKSLEVARSDGHRR